MAGFVVFGIRHTTKTSSTARCCCCCCWQVWLAMRSEVGVRGVRAQWWWWWWVMRAGGCCGKQGAAYCYGPSPPLLPPSAGLGTTGPWSSAGAAAGAGSTTAAVARASSAAVVCMYLCVRACVRACVRGWVGGLVRACARAVRCGACGAVLAVRCVVCVARASLCVSARPTARTPSRRAGLPPSVRPPEVPQRSPYTRWPPHCPRGGSRRGDRRGGQEGGCRICGGACTSRGLLGDHVHGHGLKTRAAATDGGA